MDNTHIAAGIFDRRAQDYQTKFMDVGRYHASLDAFCAAVTAGSADVLEIGCGPGNITHYLLEKRPDLRITGIDLAPNMLELARTNNPTATFQLMDGRDIAALNVRYDAIMCGFCLPYLSKEEVLKLIRDTSVLLRPGGVLYLSTMEGEYSSSGPRRSSDGADEMYIHFHQADYLSAALDESGFSILDLSRQVYPGLDGMITTDLLVLARRATPPPADTLVHPQFP